MYEKGQQRTKTELKNIIRKRKCQLFFQNGICFRNCEIKRGFENCKCVLNFPTYSALIILHLRLPVKCMAKIDKVTLSHIRGLFYGWKKARRNISPQYVD